MVGFANDGVDPTSNSPENEDSDGERELTNLNWLMRNQNLAWSKTIDANFEDDINERDPGILRMATGVQREKDLLKQNFTNPKSDIRFGSLPDSSKQRPAAAAKSLLKRPTPVEKYDTFINKIKSDLAEYEKSANIYKTDVTNKPPFNYSHIIGMAMLENGRVTLQQICSWIESKFAFFRVRKKWNNSIRHNLSLHHCFRNRKREEKGKGGYWELGVDPKKCDRKRIRNRKTTQSKLKPEKTRRTLDNCPLRDSPKELHACKIEHALDDQISKQKLSEVEKEPLLDSLSFTEVEVGLGLAMPNDLNPREVLDFNYLCPNICSPTNNDSFHQQFELGTIIISTTGFINEPSCLSSINTNKFGCSNMICTDNDVPMGNEDAIKSSQKVNSNRDANIHLNAPVTGASDISNSFTINYDCSNFRPFPDSDDDLSTICLHSSEIGRTEDILDNFLDVCARDY